MNWTNRLSAFDLRKVLIGLLVGAVTVSYSFASDDQPPARLASISGDTKELYGVWNGGGKAANAIYGKMKISESSIRWKGNNNDPRCTVSYQRIPEGYGVKFRDQTDNNYVTAEGGRYITYLLKIKGGKCAMGNTHFRLTLDRELPGYLAMVEYESTSNPVGRMHFFRD